MRWPFRIVGGNLRILALASCALIFVSCALSYLFAINVQRTTVSSAYGIIHARTTTVSLTWGYLTHRDHLDERRPIDFVALGQSVPRPAGWHISIDSPKEVYNPNSNWLGISRIVTIGCGSLGSTTNGEIIVPLWLLFIASALPFWGPPTTRILLRYRHNPQPGTCSVCGYDLRATPNRCPECGTIAIAGIGSDKPLISQP
jgi:hypothetical protein